MTSGLIMSMLVGQCKDRRVARSFPTAARLFFMVWQCSCSQGRVREANRPTKADGRVCEPVSLRASRRVGTLACEGWGKGALRHPQIRYQARARDSQRLLRFGSVFFFWYREHLPPASSCLRQGVSSKRGLRRPAGSGLHRPWGSQEEINRRVDGKRATGNVGPRGHGGSNIIHHLMPRQVSAVAGRTIDGPSRTFPRHSRWQEAEENEQRKGRSRRAPALA